MKSDHLSEVKRTEKSWNLHTHTYTTQIFSESKSFFKNFISLFGEKKAGMSSISLGVEGDHEACTSVEELVRPRKNEGRKEIGTVGDSL